MVEMAKAAAGAIGVEGASGSVGDHAAWINAMAQDLLEHKGKSLVVAGQSQSPYVHALAFAMNSALGNIGQTVDFVDPFSPNTETSQLAQFKELVGDIDAGRVKMLVILGANPTYGAPSDLRFTKERLDKIRIRFHAGEYKDETAAFCHWHASGTNYLEAWSDGRAFDGTVSISQPLVKPLYKGRSPIEVLQLVFKENFDKKGFDIVREFWQKQGLKAAVVPNAEVSDNPAEASEADSSAPAAAPAAAPVQDGSNGSDTFETNWRRTVHQGFVSGSASTAKAVTASSGFVSDAPTIAGDGALEIGIVPDPSVYDGRFTNNGWLQEVAKSTQ